MVDDAEERKSEELTAAKRNVWILMFLIFIAHNFPLAWSSYTGRAAAETNRSDVIYLLLRGTAAYAIFLVVVVVVILFLLRRSTQKTAWASEATHKENTIIEQLFQGILGAAIAFVAAIPLLLHPSGVYVISDLMPGPSSRLEGLLLTLVFLLFIPAASESLFRVRLLPECSELLGPITASVALATVYAYVWPFPSLTTSFLLALAASFVYLRSKSRLATIIANSGFTLLAYGFVTWLRAR